MRRILRDVMALAVVASCAGCATGQGKLQVFGRPVTVVTDGPNQEKLQGELLAVTRDQLWLRGDDGVQEIPLGSVREVRVKRHGFGAAKALIWAAVGGLATGGALTAACASVEGNNDCGEVGLAVAGAWLAVGALAAPSMEHSSRIRMETPASRELGPFARFPQGPPEGLDLRSLAATASEKRKE